MDQDRSEQLIPLLGPGVQEHRAQEQEYRRVVDALDVDPDRPSQTMARREQTLLRSMLLRGRNVAPCGICDQSLPDNLLVAAHIKPRANCTREEKYDIPNVAMLMCKLGCDTLFELGYLGVVNGVVGTRQRSGDPPRLSQTLASLKGRACSEWNEQRSGYFGWHEANVRRPV